MIRVLAVDDEAPIRQWLQYHISRFDGFSCVTAQNGARALQLFEDEHPDVVLTDIEMPGMDGLEMLRRMRQKEADLYVIILTSHSDFAYARTALTLGSAEYILKTEMTESSLLTALQKAADALRARTGPDSEKQVSIERYLRGLAAEPTGSVPTAQELQSHGIVLGPGPLVVTDVETAQPAEVEKKFRQASESKQLYTFTLGANHCLVLCNPEQPETVAKLCEELLIQGIAQAVGVCDTAAGAGGLRWAIGTARYRCSLVFYEPGCRLFTAGVAADTSAAEEAFQIDYMRALLNQNFAVAQQVMQGMLATFAQTRPADIAAVRKLLCTAVSSYMHFVQEGAEEVDARSADTKATMNAAASLGELEAVIEKAFAPVAALKSSAVGLTAPVRQAIEYMEQHYAEKITLAETAERAAFSPEYFSRLFSRETGVTYVAYLNNLRMKHAVELLETTTLKVYEIAEQVGFFSLSYFSTTFKKKFGQNPYEYQVNYQRGKGGNLG